MSVRRWAHAKAVTFLAVFTLAEARPLQQSARFHNRHKLQSAGTASDIAGAGAKDEVHDRKQTPTLNIRHDIASRNTTGLLLKNMDGKMTGTHFHKQTNLVAKQVHEMVAPGSKPLTDISQPNRTKRSKSLIKPLQALVSFLLALGPPAAFMSSNLGAHRSLARPDGSRPSTLFAGSAAVPKIPCTAGRALLRMAVADTAVPTTSSTNTTSGIARTPLWTLKATYMLIFAANVCLMRYITVYYDDLGLGRQLMGILMVFMHMMSFIGGLFWSAVVYRTGAYRKVLASTSIAGVAIVFSYLLPAVCRSLPLLSAVTLLHGFLAAPAGPIVDGLCLKVLTERNVSDEAYGDQRLWSAAVGWGGMALIAGKLVDIFGTSSIFFSYAALVLINVFVILKYIPCSQPPAPNSDDGKVKSKVSTVEWLKSLRSTESFWMLGNLLVYGTLVALVDSFLNVFIMQDFVNPSKVIIGAATAVMCAFQIPVFKYINRLWTSGRFTLRTVLVQAELVMALRCLLYAILPRSRPWLVLLVEPLHGFTFAAFWCATVEYARQLAPAGTEAKMQALINGLYSQVALATGALMWGFLAERPPAGLGFTRCFYLNACLIGVWLALWQLFVPQSKKSIKDESTKEVLESQVESGEPSPGEEALRQIDEELVQKREQALKVLKTRRARTLTDSFAAAAVDSMLGIGGTLTQELRDKMKQEAKEEEKRFKYELFESDWDLFGLTVDDAVTMDLKRLRKLYIKRMRYEHPDAIGKDPEDPEVKKLRQQVASAAQVNAAYETLRNLILGKLGPDQASRG